jgi:hypothetical protein
MSEIAAHSLPPTAAPGTCTAAAPTTPLLRDAVALAIAALAVAAPLCGHFICPHIDFFDIHGLAYALSHGEAPPDYKRAPLYPLLIGWGGRAIEALGWTVVPPIQRAAELLNAGLLAVNAVLAYLLGAGWCGRSSRWWVVWFLFLPWGLYCTAHLLIEPLIVTTLLATLLSVRRRTLHLAYVAAACAILTRYDLAGLLPAAAALPLVVWLVLTGVTWGPRAEEHYLKQIADRPTFAPLWSASVTLDVALSPDLLQKPLWLTDMPWTVGGVLRAALLAFAAAGVVILARRRDAALLLAAFAAAGYWLVHAIFPFQWERFGYPFAPLLLLLTGTGVAGFVGWLAGAGDSRGVGEVTRRALRALAVVAALLLALVAGSELVNWLMPPGTPSWAYAQLALLAVPLAWLAGSMVECRRRRWELILAPLLLVPLTHAQLRAAAPLLGHGKELRNLIDAVRFVISDTATEDRVLADRPGLLCMYAPHQRDRFLSFGQLAASDWAGALAEARERNVRYIIWHSEMAAHNAHPHYREYWRLDRFAPLLTDPDSTPDVEVVWKRPAPFEVWVLKIRDPAPAAAPASCPAE